MAEVKVIGEMDNSDGTYESANRIYGKDGLAPTIPTSCGGGHTPKVIDAQIVAMRGRNPDNPSDRRAGIHLEQRLEPQQEGICGSLTSVYKDNMVLIKQATKDGYIECEVGGVVDLNYPSSKTRRGRVQDGGKVCPTICAKTDTSLYKIESLYRIRKLTPKECWRLMGFTDEEFQRAEAVNSNTQLYKQAGNSIVVDVLQGIFKSLLERDEEMKQTKTTYEFETDKMIDLAALYEKEPELFEELAEDYPCEKATYVYNVE